jgi:hypothetical protein
MEYSHELQLKEHHTEALVLAKNARITYCNQARGQEMNTHDSLAPVAIARTI